MFQTSFPQSLTCLLNIWIWKFSQLEWPPPKKTSELIFISYLEYLFPNFDFKNLKKFCQEAWDISTRLNIKLRTLLSMSKRGTERKQWLFCIHCGISVCLALRREWWWLFQAGRDLSCLESHRAGNELDPTNQPAQTLHFAREETDPGRLSCPGSLS